MKKRREIYRMFRPSMRMYFLFLVIFAAAAALTGQYPLAAGEVLAVIILAVYSWLSGRRRRKKVLDYIEAAAYNLEGASKGMLLDMPLPMVIFGMNDGKVLWSNEEFLNITGDREHFFEVQMAA